jgi:hypothetical protein
VDLDVVAVDPVGAHRVLERRLDAEDEGVAALAQVDEAPVHALVEAAVGGDRRLGQRGGGDLERRDLDLDAAELDALVVLELAGDRQEGAGGQFRDQRGEGERRGILVRPVRVGTGRGVHELHGAGLIAQDDELHLLLIADGLDPSGHRTGPSSRDCSWLTRVRSLTRVQSTWVAARHPPRFSSPALATVAVWRLPDDPGSRPSSTPSSAS